jgi:hypothetical protein
VGSVVLRPLARLLTVAAAAGLAEAARQVVGPARAVGWARRLGARCRTRKPSDLADLRRLIAGVDRRLPGGPNCYRRALAEMALDGGSATRPLVLGVTSRGGPGSGHAWVGDGRGRDQAYDAEFAI